MDRILVIDDNAELRTIFGAMLESAGYEVTLAPGGHEGLDHYRAHFPDLVITDLFMPGMDGFETISRLTAEFPSAKIIAMSGHEQAGDMLAIARQLGASETLQKPFSAGKLLAAVEGLLHAKAVSA